MWRGCFEPAN
ncbi:hypothetical protein Zm00014a_009865 [Zea mays]|uniref:Uncharacterized protein n=1 Tax=Zea mays TaxID=4577 RepID=A0A3L6ENI4_MAIZE|nr:hypothetical protein Zm00014a_009865 [Zea mays]